MRIKTIKPVLMAGVSNTKPVPVGTVVDSDGDGGKEREYRALVKRGYAKETNEKVGPPASRNLPKMTATPGSTVRASAKKAAFDPAAAHKDDDFFNEVIGGTVADVEANLDGLDGDSLARLEYLEGQRDGGGRKGALDAIGKARAAHAEGSEG
jgi:hypothetical protein